MYCVPSFLKLFLLHAGCGDNSFFPIISCFLCIFRSFSRKGYLRIHRIRHLFFPGKCEGSSFFFSYCCNHKTFPASNHSLSFYAYQALSVFILYVRCTAIDPADPGILIEGFEADKTSVYTSHVGTELTGK